MYEFVILFCIVMGSGSATDARCEYMGSRDFVTASACFKAGQRFEQSLRAQHIEVWKDVPAGERASFVADVVCAEQSI